MRMKKMTNDPSGSIQEEEFASWGGEDVCEEEDSET